MCGCITAACATPLLSALTVSSLVCMWRMFRLHAASLGWLITLPRGQRQSSMENMNTMNNITACSHKALAHTRGTQRWLHQSFKLISCKQGLKSKFKLEFIQNAFCREKKKTTFLLSLYFGDDKLQSTRVKLWFTFYLLKRRQRGRTDHLNGSVDKPMEMEVSATEMMRRHVNDL